MDILDTKSNSELLRSIIAELAKARNELACAKGDLDKANSRITFLLAVANTVLNRSKE
jgi:hypothetical protein